MDEEKYSFYLFQGGVEVASGSGPRDQLIREALHYAAMYVNDGNVRLVIRTPTKETAGE